ncbi:MAG: hypothetical protein SFV54_09445 [Bryobacteraceae bacterium]|nr:hypothetical protein [Bryobacteraceae bacterium]
MRRFLALAVLLLGVAAAQMKMTVEQLVGFIRSSIELKHDDRQVAAYLKKVTLSQRLDPGVVEDLQGLGAGPKTVQALNEMATATASLPAAGKTPAPPPPPTIPPPPEAEQKRVIEEAREYALSYSKRLPDFICTQVTRRYVDPSGLEFWQRQDVVTVRLSYFEQKEDYKVIMVNNQATDVPYERLGGTTSSGEFGSMLREIFEAPTEAEFKWERWGTLRGRRMHVYSYRVRQPKSKYRIVWDRSEEIVAGYRGLVYVEKDVPIVHRVTLIAENLPTSFPVQEVGTTLDYDLTKIGDREFVLPLRAEVKSRSGRLLVRNDVEFRLYRKFGAEATITFDTPEPLPESETKEQPAKKQ